jgi:hypothetical protein
MDVLRVVGNDAVHPGEIHPDEQPQTAAALCALLDIVVEDRIAQPRQIDDIQDAAGRSARGDREAR